MPKNLNAEDRGGLEKIAAHSFASATGLDDTGVALLTGVADHVYVARRITFHYPTDISALDMDIKLDTLAEDGTERDFATVADDGDITEISTVINTWIDPNPPTNTVICYKEFNPPLVLVEDDTVSIVGNDSTAANNYASTGSVAMKVTVDYEDFDAYVYWQNFG